MEPFFAELETPAPVENPEEKPVDMLPEEETPNAEEVGGEDEPMDETMEMEGFGNYGATFSVMEFVKRLLKYLVEGLVVAIAASTIPKKSLDVQDVGVIALSAAATFALLDLFAPTISYAARQGAGFGVGANLVGFPRL